MKLGPFYDYYFFGTKTSESNRMCFETKARTKNFNVEIKTGNSADVIGRKLPRSSEDP